MATATRDGTTRVAQRELSVATTRDRAMLREFLDRDRLMAAYAICDLEDSEFGKTRWGIARRNGEPVAVVLEYRGLSPQPLFVMGESDGIAAVLRDVITPRLVYLATDAVHLPAISRLYRVEPGPPMLRMWVNRHTFRPASGVALRLLPVEIGDLNKLYGLGFTSWLGPDAITNGVYYGIRANGRLVAAAGTHVISRTAQLGVVGNVMTHPDHRNQGHAKLTTSAVTQELLRYCNDVVLNVRSDNPPAIAAYQALGYSEYGRFEERLSRRRGAPWDSIVRQLRNMLFRPKET
jgi:ribosomal protein S18 acetylase RimI-like enzyme